MHRIREALLWISRRTFDSLNFLLAFLALVLIPVLTAIPDAQIQAVIIAGVLAGTGLLLAAIRTYARRYSRAYYPIVITQQETYAHKVLNDAERYFGDRRIPIADVPPVIVYRGHDAHRWVEALRATLQRLNELNQAYRENHLVAAGYWLWDFALGTEVGGRYRITFYHHQGTTFYPIWETDRSLRAIASAEDFQYTVCTPPAILSQGSREDGAALVVAIGSHAPGGLVTQYLARASPDLPLWILQGPSELDPHAPDHWIQAGAEVARAVADVSQSGTKELWLFGVAPAVLGLIAGTMVGRYWRIHLMQYIEYENAYRDLLTLPVV